MLRPATSLPRLYTPVSVNGAILAGMKRRPFLTLRRHNVSVAVVLTVIALASALTWFRLNQFGVWGLIDRTYIDALKVAEGVALAPYQYRPLTDTLYVWFAQIGGFPLTLLMFIFLLMTWVLASIALYLRALGATSAVICVCLSIFFWAATSVWNALGLNSYTEIALYAVGAYAIHTRRDWLIIPITLFGALNRETFIFFTLAYAVIRLLEHYRRDPSGEPA